MSLAGEWEPEAGNWVLWARTRGHDAYWRYRDSFFDHIVPRLADAAWRSAAEKDESPAIWRPGVIE